MEAPSETTDTPPVETIQLSDANKNCSIQECELCRYKPDVPFYMERVMGFTLSPPCGNTIATYQQVTLNVARATCCKHEKRLVTFNTVKEMECYIEFMQTLVGITGTHKFWVDGFDFGCSGNYTWCGADQANQAIEGIELYWADGKAPSPSQRTGCLSLDLSRNKPGLVAEPCDANTLGFICESAGEQETNSYLVKGDFPNEPPPTADCTKPSCPRLECVMTLPANISQEYVICDDPKMLWLLMDRLTHKNSMRQCCYHKTYPAMFKNLEDIRCLAESVKQPSENPDMATIKRLWTGGMDVGCSGNYTWCARQQLFDDNLWAENEPLKKGPNANCVALTIEGPKPGLMLADCDDEYFSICKMTSD